MLDDSFAISGHQIFVFSLLAILIVSPVLCGYGFLGSHSDRGIVGLWNLACVGRFMLDVELTTLNDRILCRLNASELLI